MNGFRRLYIQALATIVLGLLTAGTAGAVPGIVTFAGRLSTGGNPVEGPVALEMRLFDDPTTGAQVWTEAHAAVEAVGGMIFVDLGSQTTLDSTVFDGGAVYLEIVIAGEVLAPRVAIHSVPYAVTAGTAENLGPFGADDVLTTLQAGAGLLVTPQPNSALVELDSSGCVAGEVWKFNGTRFTCMPDLDTDTDTDTNTTYNGGNGVDITGTTVRLSSAGCVAGEVWKFNGTAFDCVPDTDTNTTYSGGNGVDVAGTTVRLSSTGCVAGEVWKFNGTTFDCVPDTDTNTTYTAGTGIAITGTTVALGGTLATDKLPRWNGTALADSHISQISNETSTVCTITGTTYTTVSPSIATCHAYCVGLGYPGGTVNEFSPKTCMGSQCAYISDFTTCAISFVGNAGFCSCAAQQSCQCILRQAIVDGSLKVSSGYLQVPLATAALLPGACDAPGERGRIAIDTVAGTIKICADSGWVTK